MIKDGNFSFRGFGNFVAQALGKRSVNIIINGIHSVIILQNNLTLYSKKTSES